jgi:ornithine--oxo-acid transaminase
VRIPFNDLAALENALKDPAVAAFIVEPIQGEAGINVPDEGYLKAAFDLCVKANALFIADEIQTGLGRTGKLLACQHEGVKPHATLLGKALSGGTFPVSAVIADEPLMKMLQPGDHGSTFGGSPFACHVALESLKVIEEEGLSANADRMGNLFRSLVKDLNNPLVKEVRGKGLLNAVALELGGSTEKDAELSLAFAKEGLVVKTARPNVFRFAPPLVINEEQVREVVAILDRVLKRL